MSDGDYISQDRSYSVVLNKKSKKFILYDSKSQKNIDSILLGDKYIIPGCPGNYSNLCDFVYYPMNVKSLFLLGKTIKNPVLTVNTKDDGNGEMVICEKSAEKTYNIGAFVGCAELEHGFVFFKKVKL